MRIALDYRKSEGISPLRRNMDIGINLVYNVCNTINWYFRFFQFNSNGSMGEET